MLDHIGVPVADVEALYADRVTVRHDPPQHLNPADPLTRAAVRSAATYLEIPLPPDWA